MVKVGRNLRGVGLILVVAFAVGATADHALAQFGAGDIVVGLSGPPGNTFRVYDSSANSWSNGPDWQSKNPQTGVVGDIGFMQAVEFDNANGLSHNARGNLLAVNFGNSFTGFQIHNLATNGSTTSEMAWSVIQASGGTINSPNPPTSGISIRGGGLSVSPNNNYVAFTTFDAGPSGGREIWVLDYNAGASVGTGAGATISGPRHTSLVNSDGVGGGALATVTQGTTWLSDTKLVAMNGFGELITLDVAGIAGGTQVVNGVGTFAPTVMNNWKRANTEVTMSAPNFLDIEYNPAVDPNHIYASATTGSSPNFVARLFAYNYNPATGAISLNKEMTIPNSPIREPREIALGPDGALYYSGFTAGTDLNLVMKLPDASDIAGWDPADVQVFYTDGPATFSGLDVAYSEPTVPVLLGDYNENDILDAADYTVWRDAFAVGGTIPNDPTGGVATQADFDYWKTNFGAELGSGAVSVSVPEPATCMLLLGVAIAGAATRSRTSRRA